MAAVIGGIVEHRQRDLAHIAGALGSGGLPPGFIERRQQNGNEQRDDPDDHQQLNQGERSRIAMWMHWTET
jgi:hypothetical protein